MANSNGGAAPPPARTDDIHAADKEPARQLSAWPDRGDKAYSIGTLVTDVAMYERMRRSLEAGGFTGPDCEFLPIDNTGPRQTDAYAGLNRVLDAARGRYVILCHQDVLLLAEGRADLDRRLAELESRDPAWAVAGNAGGIEPGRLAIRITDPHGKDTRRGTFPQRVASVDENFIVVKRSARIGFSRDLQGFHFYGTDICMAASMMGYAAYVIDFHLEHLSPGNSRTADFARCLKATELKWSRAMRPRWVQTTCALLSFSSGNLGLAMRRSVGPRLAKVVRRREAARSKGGRS